MSQPLNDGYYTETGHPLKCACCEGVHIKETVVNSIDVGVGGGGIPCEISYRCSDCDSEVGYWAYGSFSPSAERRPLFDPTTENRNKAKKVSP